MTHLWKVFWVVLLLHNKPCLPVRDQYTGEIVPPPSVTWHCGEEMVSRKIVRYFLFEDEARKFMGEGPMGTSQWKIERVPWRGTIKLSSGKVVKIAPNRVFVVANGVLKEMK